jgi:chromosomal replication initiator protein DnaA
MEEKKVQAGVADELPKFLTACIQAGIIDEKTAKRVEEFRRQSGVGLTSSLSKFSGVPMDQIPGHLDGIEEGKLYTPMLFTTPAAPEMTFDTFVPSKMNSFTIELAKIVANQGSTRSAYNPLYIYADVGIGKTHLLSAIANAARNRQCVLVNTTDLEVEFERALRLGVRAEFRQWVVSYGVLLLDDIQLCEGREELQREVFSIINHMIRTGRSVVISSDVPPTQLEGVEKRLLSRLGGGAIVALHMADKSAREVIVRQIDSERELPSELVETLAEKITDSVRQLKAAVQQLLAIGKHGPDGLTPESVQEVLSMTGAANEAEPVEPVSEPAPRKAAPAPELEKAARFKKMLAGAETEEEQALALQIALGERLRQLRTENGEAVTIKRLEKALDLLRQNKLQEAIKLIGG